MTEPALAPRNPLTGIIVVWVGSLLGAIAIGIFVPEETRVPWLIIAFGSAVILSFAAQLWHGQTQGYIFRVSVSVLGALLLLGVVSTGFGLAALVPA